MSRKEDMIDEMIEFTESTVSVDCQGENCSKTETEWCIDDPDFCNQIYKKGWRIVNGEILCPSCVKKSKPQPKKKN